MSDWLQLIPANAGGGRKRNPPGGRIAADGQFTINHAAFDLIAGEDVLIDVDLTARALRVRSVDQPDRNTWRLTGGGNTQHRTKLTTHTKRHPAFVGAYSAIPADTGLIFISDDTQSSALASTYTWRPLRPNASNTYGTQQALPAQLLPAGELILAGHPVELLGSPDYLHIWVNTARQAFRLSPAPENNATAWRFSGTGTTQRRVRLTAWIKENPTMAGPYHVTPYQNGIQLNKSSGDSQ